MSELIEITQYKIICKNENVNFVYNGHTKNYDRRIQSHKNWCKNKCKNYNNKIYQIIRENGGFDNFEFIILETHYVENIIEARERERYWFDTLQSNMNTQVPNRTLEEYYKTEQRKVYQQNREKTEHRVEYKKKYIKLKMTCECGSIFTKVNLSQHLKTKKHLDFIN
jgi:hypothetical protein